MSYFLRVMQLNAASLFEPNWSSRRFEILAWLDHLDPDVVCLQEIWEDDHTPNTAGWLVAQQPSGRWCWTFGGLPLNSGTQTSDNGYFGSAILSRWPIQRQEVFSLPFDQRDLDESDEDQFSAELLAIRTAGVDIFSTHLPPRSSSAKTRRLQVKCIDSITRAWRDPNSSLPPVLCGDFNCEPDSDEIRFLCGLTSIDNVDTSWQDAWRASEKYDHGYTVHPANPYFAPFNLSARRIDYVFVGPTSLVREVGSEGVSNDGKHSGKILAANVVCNTALTGTLASDHYGVSVDISWPDRRVVQLKS